MLLWAREWCQVFCWLVILLHHLCKFFPRCFLAVPFIWKGCFSVIIHSWRWKKSQELCHHVMWNPWWFNFIIMHPNLLSSLGCKTSIFQLLHLLRPLEDLDFVLHIEVLSGYRSGSKYNLSVILCTWSDFLQLFYWMFCSTFLWLSTLRHNLLSYVCLKYLGRFQQFKTSGNYVLHEWH